MATTTRNAMSKEEIAYSSSNNEMKQLIHRLEVLQADCVYYKAKADACVEAVSRLKEEVELLELTKKWKFDVSGKRLKPSPEEEALRIAQQLENHPEVEKDVFRLLREKKTKLQLEVAELRQKVTKLEN